MKIDDQPLKLRCDHFDGPNFRDRALVNVRVRSDGAHDHPSGRSYGRCGARECNPRQEFDETRIPRSETVSDGSSRVCNSEQQDKEARTEVKSGDYPLTLNQTHYPYGGHQQWNTVDLRDCRQDLLQEQERY